jgi:peptidoglycan/xylan/chitin deacetylase (PgdA/CDA1 family)
MLPGADQLFVFRSTAIGSAVGLRRFMLPGLVALVLLAALLVARFSARPTPIQPSLVLTPTVAGQRFVLSNIPGMPPTTTATALAPRPTALPDPQAYLTYTVVQSDTLDTIVAKYGSELQAIVALNALDPATTLRVGRSLVVPIYRAGAAPDLGGQLIARGNANQPLVALTFDIEIDDKSVYSILETLRARNIKATFFVTGRWVEAFPDAARAIIRDGHELGNHSYTHVSFARIGYDGAQRELDTTEQAVKEITGATTRPYFRFPYGDSTTDMLALVGRSGYVAYHWSTDDTGFAAWVQRAAENPAAAKGAIVLMHGRAETANALAARLDQIAAAGLRATTLGEALR